MRIAPAMWAATALLLQAPGPAQVRAGVRELAQGRFLVAQRDLPDPNFAQTVVLLVSYGEDGAMGLIVNRRTKLTLGRALGDLKEAQGRSDPVYLGGPVEITGVLALWRTPARRKDARHVFANVHLVASREVLQQALSAGADSSALRVYLGYSGWAPGQLENEVELGSWVILRADSSSVFDPDPGTLWERLIRKSETRIASTLSFACLQPPR